MFLQINGKKFTESKLVSFFPQNSKKILYRRPSGDIDYFLYGLSISKIKYFWNVIEEHQSKRNI